MLPLAQDHLLFSPVGFRVGIHHYWIYLPIFCQGSEANGRIPTKGIDLSKKPTESPGTTDPVFKERRMVSKIGQGIKPKNIWSLPSCHVFPQIPSGFLEPYPSFPGESVGGPKLCDPLSAAVAFL